MDLLLKKRRTGPCICLFNCSRRLKWQNCFLDCRTWDEYSSTWFHQAVSLSQVSSLVLVKSSFWRKSWPSCAYYREVVVCRRMSSIKGCLRLFRQGWAYHTPPHGHFTTETPLCGSQHHYQTEKALHKSCFHVAKPYKIHCSPNWCGLEPNHYLGSMSFPFAWSRQRSWS